MVVIFFTTLTFVFMFFIVNSLFYSLSLLFISVFLLVSLALSSKLLPLTAILIVLIYVGAMIILIGYVCAVSPNLFISFSSRYTPFFTLFLIYPLFCSLVSWPLGSSSPFISSYSFFYSSYGVSLLVLLAFILFVTLLIVTSQYLAPNGPFRSVSLT